MKNWTTQLIAVAVGAALTTCAFQAPLEAQGRGRGRGKADAARSSLPGRVIPQKYEEPAFARGYADGYEQGNDDGKDRDRYDAVGHKDYREGDEGYFKEYGPKEAYRNNYRSGFREGYEAGYRAGQWRR